MPIQPERCPTNQSRKCHGLLRAAIQATMLAPVLKNETRPLSSQHICTSKLVLSGPRSSHYYPSVILACDQFSYGTGWPMTLPWRAFQASRRSTPGQLSRTAAVLALMKVLTLRRLNCPPWSFTSCRSVD